MNHGAAETRAGKNSSTTVTADHQAVIAGMTAEIATSADDAMRVEIAADPDMTAATDTAHMITAHTVDAAGGTASTAEMPTQGATRIWIMTAAIVTIVGTATTDVTATEALAMQEAVDTTAVVAAAIPTTGVDPTVGDAATAATGDTSEADRIQVGDGIAGLRRRKIAPTTALPSSMTSIGYALQSARSATATARRRKTKNRRPYRGSGRRG